MTVLLCARSSDARYSDEYSGESRSARVELWGLHGCGVCILVLTISPPRRRCASSVRRAADDLKPSADSSRALFAPSDASMSTLAVAGGVADAADSTLSAISGSAAARTVRRAAPCAWIVAPEAVGDGMEDCGPITRASGGSLSGGVRL